MDMSKTDILIDSDEHVHELDDSDVTFRSKNLLDVLFGLA
jgi:hypothetical protein